jgi:hypothetical protein
MLCVVAASASDDAARAFLRALVTPKQRREARMCERFATTATVVVPTRWGDVAA